MCCVLCLYTPRFILWVWKNLCCGISFFHTRISPLTLRVPRGQWGGIKGPFYNFLDSHRSNYLIQVSVQQLMRWREQKWTSDLSGIVYTCQHTSNFGAMQESLHSLPEYLEVCVCVGGGGPFIQNASYTSISHRSDYMMQVPVLQLMWWYQQKRFNISV